MENLSTRLTNLMKEQDISVSELARRTKLSKSSVSAYALGEYNPKQRALYALSKYFNVPESYLMGWSDNRTYNIEGNNNIVNTGNNAKTYAGEGNSFTITNTTVEEANPAESNADDVIKLQKESGIVQDDILVLLQKILDTNIEILAELRSQKK